MTHYIYALHDGDHQYRYIGACDNIAHRMNRHRAVWRAHPERPIAQWAADAGYRNVEYHVLEEVTDKASGHAAEVEWIQFFVAQQYKLFNKILPWRTRTKPKYVTIPKSVRQEIARFGGHKAWHINRGIVKDDCVYCAGQPKPSRNAYMTRS